MGAELLAQGARVVLADIDGDVARPPGVGRMNRERRRASLRAAVYGAPCTDSPWFEVVSMNEMHVEFLSSPEWAQMLEADLLPWLLEVADLGDDVLEVGPGPGLTTDLLRQRTSKVTALELDAELSAALATRLAGTNVEVIHADATESGLASNRFSAATCFSMLHHVSSPEIQDRLFAELHRMLRPSGAFIATDSVDSEAIRMFHVDDVFVPVDPDTLGSRLEAVGFTDVGIDVGDYQIRFKSHKPDTALL